MTKCASSDCPLRYGCWLYVAPASEPHAYANYHEQWQMSGLQTCPYYQPLWYPSPEKARPLIAQALELEAT